MRVIIINGPNLNLLGVREKSIYGDVSFEEYFLKLKEEFSNLNLEYFQSNIEGELIDKLQEVGFSYDFVLLNAGGYTHTSVAIVDCIKSIETPVYEIHISDQLIMSKEYSFNLNKKKIWVAGHNGMVGSAIIKKLKEKKLNVLTANKNDLDLTNQNQTFNWLKANAPDVIFIAAAKVGGIHSNNK